MLLVWLRFVEATKSILNSTKDEGWESPVKICSNVTALFQWDGRECQSTGTNIEAKK